MLILTRVAGFFLAVIGLIVAGAAAWFAFMGGTWSASAGDLQTQLAIQGTDTARQLAAGVAVLVGLLIALPALVGSFMRPRTVPVWLNGQQAVSVPEGSVERYLQTRVSELRDVEDAHVEARPMGARSVALGVHLLVAPDADAGAVTARVEECIEAALVSSCGIILDHRPSIRIRHATAGRHGGKRQAA